MKKLILIYLLGISTLLMGQVGIGTSTPHASSVLELSSTSKGFIPPRMTAVQRDNIASPAQGMVIYCTDCGPRGQLQVFDGVEYSDITGGQRVFTARSQVGDDIDGEASGDQSGYSVAISSDGTIVAVGAPYNDGSGSNAGHVRVFEYSNGVWSQLGSDIDGEAAGDQFGSDVALSDDGSILAVGARYNDGSGTNAGHVRVFKFSSGTWSQLGADIDGEAAGDSFGWRVSLSSDGTKLAVGGYLNADNGTNAGHARVFEYSSGTWSQMGSDIDGESAGDFAGVSVSLSSNGQIVSVGSLSNDNNGTDAGHVRVFQYSNSSWSQMGADINGESAGDGSGFVSLSSDGLTIAIGAWKNDGTATDAGHVRVYEYANGAWSQLGSDIDGEAAGDNSGWSVSLSGDGTRLSVGAYLNYGTTGSQSGHVRVFEYANGSWIQLGADIDGEASSDHSGYSTQLSRDGTTLSVGAYYNDGSGSVSGHVRVFDNLNTTGL
jgi:hypothetical protein